MKSENIAAVATPPGKGGVAIVRLSGDSPLSVAEKMFRPAGNAAVRDFEPYRMVPGEIDGGSFRDYGLCVYFRAPHSFTGEDVVEFHCHGGASIARGILRRALGLGCRLAERGEFTKRAFLNGKLSLASAEGMADMINGESEAEVRAGYLLYTERLTAAVRARQAELTELLAGIDADIDFPEEDIEHTDLADAGERIGAIEGALSALASQYRTGKKIKQGVNVVLAGRPNTGKSSLLNALLGQDKAIVSAVAGTTRDAVEGTLEIGGVRFNLYDTAGIRSVADFSKLLRAGADKTSASPVPGRSRRVRTSSCSSSTPPSRSRKRTPPCGTRWRGRSAWSSTTRPIWARTPRSIPPRTSASPPRRAKTSPPCAKRCWV